MWPISIATTSVTLTTLAKIVLFSYGGKLDSMVPVLFSHAVAVGAESYDPASLRFITAESIANVSSQLFQITPFTPSLLIISV